MINYSEIFEESTRTYQKKGVNTTGYYGAASQLRGLLMEPFEHDHTAFGERFYSSKIAIKRKSGVEDVIHVMISEVTFPVKPENVKTGSFLKLIGDIRSRNLCGEDGRMHLNVYLFVKHGEIVENASEIDLDKSENNKITLTGYLCKPPVVRETMESKRMIADLILAVNRNYGKPSYIPCIAWSRQALRAGQLQQGDKIQVTGRIQSRVYEKKTEGGKTEFHEVCEISLQTLEAVEDYRSGRMERVRGDEDGR